MRAIIQRTDTGPQGTFGAWSLPGFKCHSVELPDRNNLAQRSCIPAGQYVCRAVYSPHCTRIFGTLWSTVYQITNVPGRGNILIHPGNWAGDVEQGWLTNFLGCVGAGEKRGQLRNKNGQMQNAALVTTPAVRRIMDIFGGKPFDLEIRSC